MARGYRARHGRNCPVSTGGRRCAKLDSCGYQGEFHHSVGGKAKTVRSNKANSGVTLFATVAEAKAWTVAQQNDVQNLGIVRSTSQITLREFWESWLKLADDGLVYQRGGDRYASGTLAGYKSNMARLLKDHADKKVSTIDTHWLQQQLRQINNDMSASSANGTTTAVRALFRDSAEIIRPHGINPNPAEPLKLFKNKAVREVEPSSVKGVRERLNALPDSERPLWALFFYAGLRIAEAQGLRWQDVDDFPEQETVQRADLPDADGLSAEERLEWVPDVKDHEISSGVIT